MADINFSVRMLKLLAVGDYWAKNGLKTQDLERHIKRNVKILSIHRLAIQLPNYNKFFLK